MISMIRLFLCPFAAPLFAKSFYSPTFTDARVETYRTPRLTAALRTFTMGVLLLTSLMALSLSAAEKK
ncbi:MAG: hypothetical protein WCN98_09370, partial [Verrucomicrobiaceae bacterium]